LKGINDRESVFRREKGNPSGCTSDPPFQVHTLPASVVLTSHQWPHWPSPSHGGQHTPYTQSHFIMSADDLSAADALIGERVVPQTKRAYTSKINAIQRYYKEELGRDFAVPVQKKHILGFFGWLIDVKHKEEPLSISTVKMYKSALKWYYKEKRLVFDPQVDQQLETLLKGYQRRVSNLKLDGKMPVFEGKFHLPFAGYRLLCALLFTSQPAQMLFAWPFLILQWNLIARSNTVSSLMMEHIGWEGDALLISTPKHKGDQEGVKCFPRHVYANPSDPAICPVLALAVLTFVRSLRHDPTSVDSAAPPSFRVFDGPDSNARWSSTLARTIACVPPSDTYLLGGEKKQLGTHSVRKGAATYCAGMVNGPSAVQLFLRAGWSLGNVHDRYLFAGAGGDQLTGRVLSGLPFTDTSFATLPPHFTQEGAALISWQTILPLYPALPDTFKQALPHLLASICHHEAWLREKLPDSHPLFHSHLFASGTMADLRPHVMTGCNRTPATGMVATGIPPHLVMSNELTAVANNTQQLKEAVLARCDGLPSRLTEVLLSKFSINGAIPLTADNMREMLDSVLAQFRTELRDVRAAEMQLLPRLVDPPGDDRFERWLWGGKFHMVKEGWTFPSTNLKDTWHLWHFGHLTDRIQPLRRLKKYDLARSQVSRWSKTRGVMQAISQVMVDMKMLPTLQAVEKLTEAESSAFFDQAIVQLMEQLKPGTSRKRVRWTEMAVTTLYGRVKKQRREEAAAAGWEGEEEGEEVGEEREEREQGEDAVVAAAALSQLGN
jgi:hypothetical protein